MKKIEYFLIGLLLIFLPSCTEHFKKDEYHKLSSEQHFEISNNYEMVLSHNNTFDTLLNLAVIRAEYEEELYTGMHSEAHIVI